MRTTPTREERFVFDLVQSVLGVAIDDTGEQREPGHVDAILTYPSGEQAALEVTILGDRRVFQQLKMLTGGKQRRNVDGSRLWWDVSIGPKVKIRDFDRHFQEALLLRETHGVVDPDDEFPIGVVGGSEALQWFERNGITVFGYADTTDDERYKGRHCGAVTISVDGWGGAVADADIIPTWLSEQLTTNDQLTSKVEKLARSGHSEQHLALVVDLSAESFSVAWNVGDEDETPTTAPDLGPVTHLWLIPAGYGQTYLRWDATSGWARRELPQD